MKGVQNNLQLFRFCLYGFLKNQLYFEPFLILAFREKGLSFAAIGVLIAFRAVCINLLEIPSGAAADVWGRRKSMIVSMLGYICSFVVFALAKSYLFFFPAMLAFAVGEAFRTGTHKAMIFDWLAHEGRQDEKTKIYGLTRSWSKIGSALNAFVAAGIVMLTQSYVWIFWFSIIPYLLNIVNFCLYPKYLDGTAQAGTSAPQVWKTLRDGLRLCSRNLNLRRLIFENVCFEGFYSTAKDYLQPLLKAAALAAPVLLSVSDKNRTALLVAIIYALLNLLSSAASRNSHKAVKRAGDERRLSGVIWKTALVVYAVAAAGMFFGLSVFPILGFIALAVLLNIWKPVFTSRFYESAESESAATTLSIANQSKTLAVAVFAPLIGLAVDAGSSADPLFALWPVAVAGTVFSIAGMLIHQTRSGNG